VNDWTGTAALRLIGVQNAKRKLYARRVEWVDGWVSARDGEDSTCALLSHALDLIERSKLRSRLVVAIDAGDLEQRAGHYLQILMRAPAGVRRQLLLQIEGSEFGMYSALGEFCSFAQSRAGAGVMLKIDNCTGDELDSLLFVTGASILSLGAAVTARSRGSQHRTEVLDALEIANGFEACLMLEGVDTEAERTEVFGLGATLACGAAICPASIMQLTAPPRKVTTPEEFVSRLTMMA